MLVIGYLAIVGAAWWKALHPRWLAERPETIQQRIRWSGVIAALTLALVPAIVLALLAESVLPGLAIVAFTGSGAICYIVGAVIWASRLALRLRFVGAILISLALSFPTTLTPLLVLVVPLVLTTEEVQASSDRLRAVRPRV